MFEIKCPKCDRQVSSLMKKFFQPGYTTLQCPFCQGRLELINAGLCHFLSGIIFAVLLVLLFMIEPPFLWIWVILLGLVCWFLNVFIVCLIGRWRVWSYWLEELSRLKLLIAVNTISTIIAGIWVFFAVKTILMPYFDLLANFDVMDDRIAETVEHFRGISNPRNIILMAVGILSLTTSGITGFVKGRVRRRAIEKSLSQTISKD